MEIFFLLSVFVSGQFNLVQVDVVVFQWKYCFVDQLLIIFWFDYQGFVRNMSNDEYLGFFLVYFQFVVVIVIVGSVKVGIVDESVSIRNGLLSCFINQLKLEMEGLCVILLQVVYK